MFRGGIGAPEIILILLVIVLLFGAKKLPELARSTGRSLRIFKAETKGLLDDDDDDPDKPAIDAQRSTTEAKPVSEPERRPEDV
jgi:sec-independent protein translocase protein TatA